MLVVALSSCNLILHFSELSLEVQGGHNYFWFVKGTCIIVLCLSSLSVLSAAFRFWLSLQKLNSICFWTVTSVGENEEKTNTIQPLPSFLCLSHLQILQSIGTKELKSRTDWWQQILPPIIKTNTWIFPHPIYEPSKFNHQFWKMLSSPLQQTHKTNRSFLFVLWDPQDLQLYIVHTIRLISWKIFLLEGPKI